MSRLVEREECRAAITAVLAESPEGRGRGLLIEGPAGIGKTAMLDEAERSAAGMVVLRAAAGELESDLPLGVVRQLFEPALWRASDAERERWLRGPAAMAGRIIGATGEAGRAEPFPVDAAAARSAFYWLAVAMAEDVPAVVLVDDLHWADRESLAWFVFVARRLRGSRVSLLGTMRAGAPGLEKSVLLPLSAVSEVRMQRLPPLSAEGTAQLVAAWSGSPAAEPAFTATCERLAGGNPFLLTELLAEATRRGVEADREGAAKLDGMIGDDLARAVSLRLRSLGDEALALAQAVSIVGASARLGDAAEVAGLSVENAATVADGLMASGFLRDSEQLELTHPLVRTAIVGELTSAKRAELHLRAARVLASADDSDERIGAHLLAAPPSGDGWVVDRLVAAADRARAGGAPAAAARLLRRALAEPPRSGLRAELHASLGSALCTAGDSGGLEHIEIARALTADAAQRRMLGVRLGTPYLFLGRGEDVARMLRRELDEAEDARSSVAFSMRAALTATPAYGAEFDPRPLVAELIGEASNLKQLPTIIRPAVAALAVTACAAAFPSSVVKELARRAIGDPSEHEQAIAEGYPLLPALVALAAAEDQDGLDARLDAVETGVWRRGAVALGLSTLLWTRGTIERLRGNLEAAADYARAAADINAEGSFSIPRAQSALLLAGVLRERGDVDGAERVLAETPLDMGSGMWAASRREELAAVALTRGDSATAFREALAAGERMERIGVVNPPITRWRSVAALAAHAGGDRDAAECLAAEQLRFAEAFGAPGAVGIALRVHGMVTTDADALEKAERKLSDSPDRLEHSRALIELGAALRRQGQRVRAREPLFAGLEAASRCGAEPLADQALVELRAAGARPRNVMRTGLDALTPSEHRVARLAAAGRTSREIAAELFVTKATVETHLRSIYRKLDIGSRAELSARLSSDARGAPT